jgi:hypothetical protein
LLCILTYIFCPANTVNILTFYIYLFNFSALTCCAPRSPFIYTKNNTIYPILLILRLFYYFWRRHYISTLPFCTLSYIISLLFHTVHYHTFYPYSSMLYTILHSISALPYCTLSYILSLLLHTVHYLTFYPYSSIMYTVLHSIHNLPYCTLSHILWNTNVDIKVSEDE